MTQPEGLEATGLCSPVAPSTVFTLLDLALPGVACFFGFYEHGGFIWILCITKVSAVGLAELLQGEQELLQLQCLQQSSTAGLPILSHRTPLYLTPQGQVYTWFRFRSRTVWEEAGHPAKEVTPCLTGKMAKQVYPENVNCCLHLQRVTLLLPLQTPFPS